MGGAASREMTREDLLSTFESEEERNLLRNFQLLASRDMSEPETFGADDFSAVPLGMPPELAAAVFRSLGTGGASADLDAVVRAVGLPLADEQALAAGFCLHDACGEAGGKAAHALCMAAAAWLGSVDVTTVPEARAARWRRLCAAFGPAAAAPPAPSSSRQAFAEEVAGTPALLAAARVLASAVQAAWLIDHRRLGSLPSLAEGTSELLREADMRLLNDALPPRCRRTWRLAFSSRRDGTSFSRLCALGSRPSATLLVARDEGGAVFGGFCSQQLRKSPAFFGDYTCFIYTLRPAAAVHRASGENANLVYLNQHMEQLPNGLAFGGQTDSRFFGLWLRDDLETGRSCAPCSTYQNAAVLSSAGEFKLDAVELWAVDDDVPEEEPQGTALDGVLGEQHAEARHFLELAGKKSHAAELAPLEPEQK